MNDRRRAGACTFFFDGGARPNPGPVEVAVVGGGRTHIRDDLGSGDNTHAEWLALLFAAEIAAAEGAADVIFVGDCASVVQQARGQWPCRNAQARPHLAAFAAASARFSRVRLRHVPRSRNLAGIALGRRGLPG